MMPQVLVSLLGKPPKGFYDESTYSVAALGKNIALPSEFPFEVLSELFTPDEIILIGTEQSIWEYAREKSSCKFSEVIIPSSEQESDQWRTFEIVSQIFNRDAEFILDITHGYRHLPLLSFLSAQFVRSLNPKCSVKHVFYGLYDSDLKRTHMIDLSKFMAIMDWTQATRMFSVHGKGHELADLFQATGDQSLNEVGSKLNALSDGLELLAVPSIPERASGVQIEIERAKPKEMLEIFSALKGEMLSLPTVLSTNAADWEKALILTEWYKDHEQWAKAIISLRETVVTFIGEICGFDYEAYDERELITKNILQRSARELLRESNILVKLWRKITKYRNEVGHSNARLIDTDRFRDISQVIQDAGQTMRKIAATDKEVKILTSHGEKQGMKKRPNASLDDLINHFKA